MYALAIRTFVFHANKAIRILEGERKRKGERGREREEERERKRE